MTSDDQETSVVKAKGYPSNPSIAHVVDQ